MLAIPPSSRFMAAYLRFSGGRGCRATRARSPRALSTVKPEQAVGAQLLPLRELGRAASLVEAGLLALHDAGVARQEPGALERHAQVRVGLDEGSGDPVPHRAGLAALATAVDAHAEIVGPFGARDLERREREHAVRGAR